MAGSAIGGAAVTIRYDAQPMVRLLNPHMLSPSGYMILQDCSLHPSEPMVAAVLISGHVGVHRCGAAAGTAAPAFSLKAHKESARAVRFSPDGRLLVSASADKSLLAVDAATGQPTARKADAHAAGIDRLLFVSDAVLASGDDDGRIQLWDMRQAGAAGGFAAHTDYISDMAAHAPEKALLATSGDGTLSVNDLRTLKVRARSEDDAEEELLCVGVLKGGRKVAAGASDGVLNVFSWGYWNDCSDRYPGHPASVDCMVAVDDDTIATGAADGIIRLMTIQPNRMLGVLGSHGSGAGSGEGDSVQALAYCAQQQLLASAGLDDTVRLWSLAEDGSEGSAEAGGVSADDEAAVGATAAAVPTDGQAANGVAQPSAEAPRAGESDDGSDSDDGPKRKRKQRKSRDKGVHRISTGRGGGAAGSSFFADL